MKERADLLEELRAVIDEQGGRYSELKGARDLAEYLDRPPAGDDEEVLTESILERLIERVLGFPADAYLPQRGKGGLKPDFTPKDLLAHSFVLDAKSTSHRNLDSFESQIRKYMDQRHLDYGVLFNLREFRTYRRGRKGCEPDLSFPVLPLWRLARGETLVATELDEFWDFCERFRYRVMSTDEKLRMISTARPWAEKEMAGELLEVDVDFLVAQLRELSQLLAEDAAAQDGALRQTLMLQPGREKTLLQELELLALDIAPGTDPKTLPGTVEDYRQGNGLPGRIWHQYLLRVSQLALTRILLYRAWEDVGFVDDCLYDGGFELVYERVGQNLRQVLSEAFVRGSQRYRWLYGQDNNYDWYKPRDAALVEVLYALTPVPLGKLDADVLGGLYESYVDEIDRDRLGQFYTPRDVVRFMLDRAGFRGPQGVFHLEADSRRPRRVLDFATGSGGFLVEAARRVIDQGGVQEDDVDGTLECLEAIVAGFHGSEISPFPYYLTEVNLLLQVSRLIGHLRSHGVEAQSFVLGIVNADTLAAHQVPEQSIEGFDAETRADRADLVESEGIGLIPLDSEKKAAFQRIRENEAFDLVVGNPPYVFEANNKILFDRLRSLPAWKSVYRGKSDYLYYFLYLAAEKVAKGGRLCVITPAGWMNAGNADWLREKIASSLRLDELYLFGSYRLFAPEPATARDRRRRVPTPTVESAILVATKAPVDEDHKLRIVALEDEVAAASYLSGKLDQRTPDRDALIAEMARRLTGGTGREHGIHAHELVQADLVATRPWPIKHGAEDVAARVVDHLQGALDADDSPLERLVERWDIFQGIQTGADAYTERLKKRLPPAVKERLEATGANTGDPILELPPGREKTSPWDEYPKLMGRSMEPRAILYGAIDDDDYTSLVWIARDDQVAEAVISALEFWRPVLATRAEFARNPKRRWFETAWPRDKEKMRGSKVIALYRTDRGRFALDETGEWQPSIKTTVVTPKTEDLSVAYLCGLLNSELLDLWYSIRGKIPRDVWRNYEPKPMAEIPYRHINRSEEPLETDRLRQLTTEVEEGRWEDVLALVDQMDPDQGGDESFAQEAFVALETLVRAIAANRRELLPHREYVPGLERIVKDPWSTGPFTIDEAAFIQLMPDSETVSVRVDPALSTSIQTDGVIGKAKRSGGTLTFQHARSQTAQVEGPEDRVAVVERLVVGKAKLRADDLLAIRLPGDLDLFRKVLERRTMRVGELLQAGRLLVEAAERLVCRLYGVPRDLEDEVVVHAVKRAGGGRQ